MIVKSGGADVSVKSILDEWPYSVIPPESALGATFAGSSSDPFWPFMSLEQAMGLPALLGVLLRVSTAVGMLPQKVYAGSQLDRSVAVDSWQYELLHDRPGSEHTPFTLKADVALALAGGGYSCIRKFKVRGRVMELLPLDSARVTPRRVNGRLVFEDRTQGQTVTRDTTEILYVRAPASGGGVKGLAPITLARLMYATGLKRQVFEGGYYDKSAEPRVVLSFPQNVNPDQAAEWKEVWNDQHQGLENMHSTSVTGGGATVTTVPVSLQDAQFVEANKWTADQCGFIYGMPKAFLNTAERQTLTDEDWRYFTTFGLGWLCTAIDQAFTADLDLFPRGSRMHAETLADALLKPDIQKRYDAYKAARQAGWLTPNEIRALENYPPIDGGDVLQITPVGGAVDNTGTQADAVTAKALELLADEFKDGSHEQQAILARLRERAHRNGHLPELLHA